MRRNIIATIFGVAVCLISGCALFCPIGNILYEIGILDIGPFYLDMGHIESWTWMFTYGAPIGAALFCWYKRNDKELG